MAGEKDLSAGRRRASAGSAVLADRAGRGGRGGRGAGGGPPSPAGAGRATAGQPAAGGDLPPPPPPDPNAKYATIDTSGYDPLLGCTIGEVGSVAASMHKCQGRSPIQNFGGVSGARYKLAATVIESQKNKDETSLFEGIDTSLASLLQYGGANPPAALRDGIAAITTRGINAQKAFQGSQNPAVTLPDLLAGLTAVRALRAGLGSMGLTDLGKYEIDFRMAQKEAQFQQAIILAHGLRMDAIADDGVVMGNQPIRVTTNVANRGPEDVTVKSVKLSGFDGDASCPPAPLKNTPAFNCGSDVKIPANAKLTNPVLGPAARLRPRRARGGSAVRPAVPSVAVPRAVRLRHQRRRSSRRRCRSSTAMPAISPPARSAWS